MRDYLRTLNKNELFQLEKLLCTNEEINLTQLADEGTGQCCDDKTKTPAAAATTTTIATTNVTILTNNSNESNGMNKSNENFYTLKANSSSSNLNNNGKSDDWVAEDAEGADDEADEEENSEGTSNYENLVTADCATGYLVPNTTLGNLLQSNEAPLTYNIVISDNNNENANETDQIKASSNCENGTVSNRDSGLGTGENGSLDQSPEQEQNTNVLTGQYDENWENLRKIVEPSSSKSSSHHHRHKEHKSGKRKSRKHQSSSSETTSSSCSASSSASSSPSSSDSRDLSRRAKFK